KKYRVPLLQAGVELYEFDDDPAIQHTVVDAPPNRSEFSALHAKAMVVDRQRVFIGTLNLDPRSIKINTEMGMIIDSRDFAERLATLLERDMKAANSWRVHLDDKGELYWESDEGIVHRQPARSGWQRFQGWFLGLAPKDQL
ncbi:MAG: phospholipase D family protein, partial [Acidobacteria bacterium]|nr:phospholipase D family protein [Candidatus Sulfomarinibacter kjeldsenii]